MQAVAGAEQARIGAGRSIERRIERKGRFLRRAAADQLQAPVLGGRARQPVLHAGRHVRVDGDAELPVRVELVLHRADGRPRILGALCAEVQQQRHGRAVAEAGGQRQGPGAPGGWQPARGTDPGVVAILVGRCEVEHAEGAVERRVAGDAEVGQRPGAVALRGAVQEIVQQRREPARGHFGVMPEIGGRVEIGRRRAALVLAALDVVQQRLHPGLRHIGAVLQVVGGAEQRMRVEAFAPAGLEVVRQRIGG